jgi:hypothetical protein
VPEPPSGAFALKGRFERFGSSAFAYVAQAPFEELADTNSVWNLSPVILYESDHAFGPAHGSHPDIGAIGQGRFSDGIGIVVSTSDNSNPNYNGGRYSIVQP